MPPLSIAFVRQLRSDRYHEEGYVADEKGQYRATVVELPRETIEKIASDLNVSDISRIPNKIVITGLPEEHASKLGVSRGITHLHATIIA
jgi:hypothetical protein